MLDIEAEKAKLAEYLADEHSRMPEEDRAFLVEKLIGREDPISRIWKSDPVEYIDANTALRYIDSFDLMRHRMGWLDRIGKLWSCAYASHERMCRLFGWEEKDLERAGWIRIAVGERGYFTMRRSKKQIKWMEEHKIRHEYEEEADFMPIPTFEFIP